MNTHATTRITLANSESIAPPAGHYSHVCSAGGMSFISGMLPIAKDGTPMSGAPFDLQASQVLSNLQACLDQVGLTKEDLVQVRVYVTDITKWPEFNRLYADWIGTHRPARAVAGVAELHFGLVVEVEAVALSRRAA